MLNNSQVNVLGNVIKDSYGFGNNKSGQRSVVCSLQDDLFIVKFKQIVHFASERSLSDQTRVVAHESIERISSKLDDIRAGFKDAAGKSLKLEEVTNRDNVELISATANSPRKIAYYRRHIVFKIDV